MPTRIAIHALALVFLAAAALPANADEHNGADAEVDTLPFVLIGVEPASGEAEPDEPAPLPTPEGALGGPAIPGREPEELTTRRIYSADKSEAAKNFSQLLRALAPTLDAASKEIGGYEVDTIELHVEMTAEGGFSLIASAGVAGGIKLTFKRTQPIQTSAD